MPRRIVLHAGFHETGAAFVHRFLRANRAALKPALAIRLKPQMRDLLKATRGYSVTRDAETHDTAQHAFNAILTQLPRMPKRTLILSADDLCGQLPGRQSVRDYGAAAELLYGFVSQIRAGLPDTPVTLYFSTRASDEWLQSAYWQHVKTSSMSMEFAEFAALHEPACDLAAVVDAIAARVPCVTRRVALEDCAMRPFGPADPILDLCDVPDHIRANLSPLRQDLAPDYPVLLKLLAANRAHATPRARRAAKDAILAHARAS